MKLNEIFSTYGIYLEMNGKTFGEKPLNPSITISTDNNVLEIAGELPPPEILHTLIELIGGTSPQDVITALLDKDDLDSILKTLKDLDDRIEQVEYTEESIELHIGEKEISLPLKSATAGALGTLIIKGKPKLSTILSLLSSLDAITSIAEGVILTLKSMEMIRSSLKALSSAMQSRVKEGEKLRSIKERLFKAIKDKMGLNEEVYDLAFEIYDVGLIGVKDAILQKSYEELDEEERTEYEKHPEYGYEILKNISGIPKEILDATLYHHERMDGSGFPKGLKKDQIPEIAYILGMIDEVSKRLASNEEKGQIVKDLVGKFPDKLLSFLEGVL